MTAAAQWNLALLDEAIARIEANPEHWQQDVWRCGTGCCLAGHVALAAGATWAADAGDCDVGDDVYVSVIPSAGSDAIHVAAYARSVLRIQGNWLGDLLGDPGDHRSLFAESNTLIGIKAMAADLHAAQDAAKAATS